MKFLINKHNSRCRNVYVIIDALYPKSLWPEIMKENQPRRLRPFPVIRHYLAWHPIERDNNFSLTYRIVNLQVPEWRDGYQAYI